MGGNEELIRDQAVEILRQSMGPGGWVASAVFDHYAAVWTRDAAITAIGALTFNPTETKYLDCTRITLEGLTERLGKHGQVPDAYWPATGHWDWGEQGAVDASSWFVILGCAYLRLRSDDRDLAKVLIPAMNRVLQWLGGLDVSNIGLIDSPQGADWMDSTLNRSGKVLYNNVLYFSALKSRAGLALEDKEEYESEASLVRERGNQLFWPSADLQYSRLWDHVGYEPGPAAEFPHPASIAVYEAFVNPERSFYLSHVEWGRFVDRCDVFANSLAILTGFALPEREPIVAKWLAASEAMLPVPARAWATPFLEDDEGLHVWKLDTERYQAARWRNPPHRYHNGGAWPFVGGYLIAAIASAGLEDEARRAFSILATANAVIGPDGLGFHEWIDSSTGEAGGAPQQAWNAGGYLLADAFLNRSASKLKTILPFQRN